MKLTLELWLTFSSKLKQSPLDGLIVDSTTLALQETFGFKLILYVKCFWHSIFQPFEQGRSKAVAREAVA